MEMVEEVLGMVRLETVGREDELGHLLVVWMCVMV